MSEQRAALHGRCAHLCVDLHSMHVGEIDHHAAIASGLARIAVAAAFHGQQQLALASEVHTGLHIGNCGALRDQGRVLVDHGIPDLACRIVALLGTLVECAL